MRYVKSPEQILERKKDGINEGQYKKRKKGERGITNEKILPCLFL
jgi:hypothetical protein